MKNVSGFDVCRLLVGSRGTLGFLGDVILRTRPRARYEQWFSGRIDPDEVLARLYRPTSVLWDGTTTWVLLEGDERDIEAQVRPLDLQPTGGPPPLPTGGRWSIAAVGDPDVAWHVRRRGRRRHRPPRRAGRRDGHPSRPIVALHRRIKHGFDPTGRLNPGVDVLDG